MSTTDVVFPGIAGSENVNNQSLFVVSKDVESTSCSGPKICDNLIYDSVKSF